MARLRGIFQTTDIDTIVASAEEGGRSLRRTLGPIDITLLGIGAIIGAGIFATIGTAAAGDGARPGAGPSLMLSFVITAVVCAFTAFCYAEFASMVPISGSAYTYSYASLGEVVAWIIGWDLMLEYGIGNVAIAISWSSFCRSLLQTLGVEVPLWLATDYRTAAEIPGLYESAPHLFGVPIVVNVLALGVTAVVTLILILGIRESALVTAILVAIKIGVLCFFVGAAFAYISPSEMAANWTPFMPNGLTGTLTGAAIIFFAYIGFDAVSTVAEETRNPGRDLPFGIIASLGICTVLYVVVAGVFTGMVPYTDLTQRLTTEQAEPLTLALARVAPEASWSRAIVALGSLVALTAVLLVFQLGQLRIFYVMARDGLLPASFARVHPRFRTPHVTSILTGLAVGVCSAFTRIDEMVDLTNIGTLFAFILVCAGIPILRSRYPDRPRPFRVPLGPWILPGLGVASCAFLIFYLPPASWWRFAAWLLLGLAVYAGYGFSRSRIARREGRDGRIPPALRWASVGFLLAGAGMLVMPHDADPAGIVLEALRDGAHHPRAAIAVGLTAVGLGLGLAGSAIALRRRAPRTDPIVP